MASEREREPLTPKQLAEASTAYAGAVWPSSGTEPGGHAWEEICDADGNEVAEVRVNDHNADMASHRARCVVACVAAVPVLLAEIERRDACRCVDGHERGCPEAPL